MISMNDALDRISAVCRRIYLRIYRPDIHLLVRRVRPYVDAAFYLRRYEDVVGAKTEPAEHYVRYGWKEGRDPNPDFSTRAFLRGNADVLGAELFPLPHLLEKHAPPPASDRHAEIIARFAKGPLAEELQSAGLLEPRLLTPGAAPNLNQPEIAFAHMRPVLRRLRETLAPATAVILLPHGHGAGIRRIAADAAAYFGRTYGDGQVLFVLTEPARPAPPDWLPEGARLCDLGALAEPLLPRQAARLLVDLLLGVDAKQVLNIESPLAWDMLCGYGRQLSQEMPVIAYLSADEGAGRAGTVMPDRWLRHCVDHLRLILTDSEAFAGDVRARFGLAGPRDMVRTVDPSGPPEARLHTILQQACANPPDAHES